jgi:hypothetical protein
MQDAFTIEGKNKMADYTIDIMTGDMPYADTCEQVHVVLIGTKGQSEELELRKSYYDGFAQGQTDSFKLQDIPDLGKLTQIQIKLTPFDLTTSYVKAWYLNLVRVTYADKDNTTFTWTCKCCRWFGTESDQQLTHTLPVSAYRVTRQSRRSGSRAINMDMKNKIKQINHNKYKLPLAARPKES